MAKQTRKRKVDKKTDLGKIRHSASHILAEAVLNLYPNTKLGFGPATETGFYYDFDFKSPITDSDLEKIESEMLKLINEGRTFKKSEMTIAKALAWAKRNKQPYKIELIEGLKRDGHKQVTFYKSGSFVDLCEGPHVKSAKDIGAIKLLSLAGAYWRGDERNPQLTRIYGTAFAAKKDLDEYIKLREEAKKHDHRLIGEKLELFSFHPEGPGFPFWHPKGQRLFLTVLEYMREVLHKNGYGEIATPPILNVDLWHKSGHWDNYQNNMYFTEIDKQSYAIKPMNCPGGMLIFNHKLHSYRDLPIRTAEFGLVHRHELSGVLHGLFRVRSFTQDDAHIFCLPEQIKDEIKALIRMLQNVYKDFGFEDYRIELSTRPLKSIGSDAMWEKSEQIMREVAKEEKINIEVNEGEGAFYGPKFDFHVNDCLGRSWQLGTIQLDFSMPERLGAKYTDKDGTRKIPIVIHRAILGSIERFLGILIEHYGGILPLWLAPVQVKILPISNKHSKYVTKIAQELKTVNIRFETDDRNESLGKKIRDAELMKIPYMLIIGDKEAKVKSVAVRHIKQGDLKTMKINSLIRKLGEEIDSKK
ncbi:threonine--tRNA ligase [candidate division Kazan bacterium]|uniref:Threonine--tRNA ligase n=1 Tax=candidate division Kazan bacterium TaxID=2202143 RepID=A0A420ZD20_UNCK3|nr:MAG: threonine--tRNA ligase [candidate division Kazan bacterium]